MFDTARLRAWLAALWIAALAGAWAGYDWLARRSDLAPPLRALDGAVAAGDWAEAERLGQELTRRWERAGVVTQVNHGGDLMAVFDLDLARVRGAIAARAADIARAEISGLEAQWEALQASFPDGK